MGLTYSEADGAPSCYPKGHSLAGEAFSVIKNGSVKQARESQRASGRQSEQTALEICDNKSGIRIQTFFTIGTFLRAFL